MCGYCCFFIIFLKFHSRRRVLILRAFVSHERIITVHYARCGDKLRRGIRKMMVNSLNVRAVPAFDSIFSSNFSLSLSLSFFTVFILNAVLPAQTFNKSLKVKEKKKFAARSKKKRLSFLFY